MLAKNLISFEKATAKNLFLNVIDNGAEIEIIDKKILVSLRNKVHNSILFETEIFKWSIKIPWLYNFELIFDSQNSS